MVKHPPEMQEMQVRSLGQKDPRSSKWQPTLVVLPGKFHGHRRLMGHQPIGLKELDTTEWLSTSNIRKG